MDINKSLLRVNWEQDVMTRSFLQTKGSRVSGPSYNYMVSTTLPQRQLYGAFIYQNVVPVSQVKVNPAWLFIALIVWSNVEIFLFLWVSLGHPITVCFAELIFTSLLRISALNLKSRHDVTLTTPRAVPGRRAKALIWRKVVLLARVALPAEVRQLAHPSCLLPRGEFVFLM